MWAKFVAFAVSFIPVDAKISTWPLEGLNRELNGIASIESQYGKYVNHRAHPLGDFHTAFGSLGLKPSTAHWMYRKTAKLRQQFPGLEDERLFLKAFWTNRRLYTQCANTHWLFLRASTPNLPRAVYAWRWGLTASQNASDEDIIGSSYTTKYAQLITQ